MLIYSFEISKRLFLKRDAALMRPRFRKSILGKEHEIQFGRNTTENLHDTSVLGTILVDSDRLTRCAIKIRSVNCAV